MHRCIPLSIFLLCLFALASPSACTPAQSITTQQPSPTPIRNLLELAPGLYSGNEPATADHYQQLADLGIRTVISVDAVAPDPELANIHNIRIVHLPIGYDGIDPERRIQLAAAIHQLDHPIYLHCHHGKHRGPAAIGIGAIGAGLITNSQAIEFMTIAGTSKSYLGLWGAARDATPLDPSTLQSEIEFPAQEPVPGFVNGMGKLDRLHDQLWDLAENDWQAFEDHPDLSPTAVSGQIHDLLRSLLELDFFNDKGTEMRSQFESLAETAQNIESEIQTENYQGAFVSLNILSNSCIDCHDRFRN